MRRVSLVFKAVKRADRSSDGFEVKKLDKFMEKAVLDGAFDHIRYRSPSGSIHSLSCLVHSQISTPTIAEAGFDNMQRRGLLGVWVLWLLHPLPQ